MVSRLGDGYTLLALRHVRPGPYPESMLISCDTCVAPKTACADCVVTAILGAPTVGLDAPEVAALDAMASAGLVRPLRHLRLVTPPEPTQSKAG